jgi:epoxyqueuosine reductase
MSFENLLDLTHLSHLIKEWGKALGFQEVGICDIDLQAHEKPLQAWLDKHYYGTMSFFPQRGMMRARPAELLPGTCRIISVRMDYLPPDASFARHLHNTKIGYISRYALGRDYHKVLRKKLKQLGDKITAHCETAEFRPFVDSAPILEHAVAEKAGIGFTGKHSLTINPEQGSWFFLGELFINLPLPVDQPIDADCGSCSACMSICPTNAIVEPFVVDARKCVSYLTIEHDGSIPEQYRQPMGNRIYGCDDCQLVCPFNQTAPITTEADFYARPALHGQSLNTLFSWTEAEFLHHTEGSPIRRIGYAKWQRNISVALGNAQRDAALVNLLEQKLALLSSAKFSDYGFAAQPTPAQTDMLLEHLQWAIEQQQVTIENRQQARLVRIVQKGLPRDA